MLVKISIVNVETGEVRKSALVLSNNINASINLYQDEVEEGEDIEYSIM